MMSVGRERRRELRGDVGRRALDDFQLFVLVRIIDEHHEQEAVELRFGQRIGALLLDRVLRGQHEERIGQQVPLAADGDLLLLHGFQQAACVFGGVRLISSASTMLANSGPGRKRNSRVPVACLPE